MTDLFIAYLTVVVIGYLFSDHYHETKDKIIYIPFPKFWKAHFIDEDK